MIAATTSPAKPTAPRNYRLDVGLGKIKVNALLIDVQLIHLSKPKISKEDLVLNENRNTAEYIQHVSMRRCQIDRKI